MTDTAFVVMQVGEKDSLERKRADEIYNFVVAPALVEHDLRPYRADLDLAPGPITPKLLDELLNARLVIADLTGRNPNVFYELGIVHSFARPLISIADSAASLPFDTKDERVIELGEYPPTGLAYSQGEAAKDSLRQSLKIVLVDGYEPPSPLREVAANRSLDQLAPDNPVAAELAQMRETLEEIRRRVQPGELLLPLSAAAELWSTAAELLAMRNFIETVVGGLYTVEDVANMVQRDTSINHNDWVARQVRTMKARMERAPAQPVDDPWATPARTSDSSDEPPV
jgi:hypothetical protein